jgi:hypothetical protein
LKHGAGHAQFAGLGVHGVDKGLVVGGAGKMLGQGHAGVVAAGHGDALHDLPHDDAFARTDVHARAPGMGGLRRHQHGVGQGKPVLLDGLEGQVQGEHFGKGSGGNLLVGVLFIEDLAGGEIHGDDGFRSECAGIPGRVDRLCRQHDEQRGEEEDSAFLSHDAPHGGVEVSVRQGCGSKTVAHGQTAWQARLRAVNLL